jgi:hypothetical protein
MAYVMMRVYSGPSSITVDELSSLAIKELAPRLAQGAGLTRFSTLAFSDGRVGSFSLYESQDAAKRGQQIAAEWVKDHSATQSSKLEETMEGEVAYTASGSVQMTGRRHAVARIYKTDSSASEIKSAFESEGPPIIGSFTGLALYTVVKLTDGRVGSFGSFDTAENARKSSEEAKKVRATSVSQIGRLLASDPQVLEGTVVGTYQS